MNPARYGMVICVKLLNCRRRTRLISAFSGVINKIDFISNGHHRSDVPRLIAPGPNLPRNSSTAFANRVRFSSVRLNKSF